MKCAGVINPGPAMEILPCVTPVRFSCDSFASVPTTCGRITGIERITRPGGFVYPAAAALRWNWSAGCRRGIQLRVAASDGKNGSKTSNGSGKSKDSSADKKGGSRKDNIWSSGFATDRTKPLPEKKKDKKHRQNVWSSDSSSSGKAAPSLQQKSASKIRKESSDGGGPQLKSTRGHVNVVFDQQKANDGRLQPLVDSSDSSTANAEKKKNQQLEDVDDTMFLRFLSPLLPIEEETLLQPEEPVSNPVWPTFCSSTSGVWRGVGATFSPITGDFEPISLNAEKEFIYDARVLSTVETLRTSEDGVDLPQEQQSLYRRVLWSLENSVADHGEEPMMVQDDDEGGDTIESSLVAQRDVYEEDMGYWEDDEDIGDNEDNSEWENVLADPGEMDEKWENGAVLDEFEVMEEIEGDTGSVGEDGTEWRWMWDRGEASDVDWEGEGLPVGKSEITLTPEQKTAAGHLSTPSTAAGPSYGAFMVPGTIWTDVMEEDHMVLEPGLVFFEDGAYSRGPLELTTDVSTSSQTNLNACTSKVEQCLVAGGHKRLRIVHTISVEDGEKLEVLRVVVYEEEWMGPSNMKSISDAGGHQLKLFSERGRHSPEDLVGFWKVFEMEGMVVHPGTALSKEQGSFAFSCKEILIKRGFPVMPQLTLVDNNSVDMSDFSMSWLTGNVSVYVSVSNTGFLTFGVGWICENGTRLVMERVYSEDGKLVHVKSKSEIKSGSIGQ